jgi:hemin uptake protein HemP
MSMTRDYKGPTEYRQATAATGESAAPIPTMRSDVLLGAGRQLRIEHAGEWYVLRKTTNNKLILTK